MTAIDRVQSEEKGVPTPLSVYGDTWREKVIQILDGLKQAPFRSTAIASVRGYGTFLVPFTADRIQDDSLITLLTRWRHENILGFPRIFTPTPAGTRAWSQSQLILRKDRILLLVLNADERPIAHVGLSSFNFDAGTCEIDNIVRGEPDAPKGIMADAVETLMKWAYRELAPKEIWLRTFNDNSRALALYHRLGFVPVALQPLRMIEQGDVREWIDASSADPIDRFYISMRHNR